MSYSSGTVFGVAVDAYRSVPGGLRPRQWIREGNAPLVALAFSAMGFEAFVNEAVDCLENPINAITPAVRKRFEKKFRLYQQQLENRPKGFPKPAWKASCLRYAQSSLHYSVDEQPFTDLCRLIRLRNWLVHQRPWHFGKNPNDDVAKEITDLAPLGILVEIRVGQIMGQTIHISTPAATRWMCNTVCMMVRRLRVDVLEASPNYRLDVATSGHWPIV